MSIALPTHPASNPSLSQPCNHAVLSERSSVNPCWSILPYLIIQALGVVPLCLSVANDIFVSFFVVHEVGRVPYPQVKKNAQSLRKRNCLINAVALTDSEYQAFELWELPSWRVYSPRPSAKWKLNVPIPLAGQGKLCRLWNDATIGENHNTFSPSRSGLRAVSRSILQQTQVMRESLVRSRSILQQG